MNKTSYLPNSYAFETTSRIGFNPHARYLSQDKKKYNLGGNSSNLEKLKSDQLNDLNTLLVDLKSEFDNLTRETSFRKTETEKIGKQIKMLERIEKKTQVKALETVQNNESTKKNLEIRKNQFEQERYTRQTLQGLHDRLQNDLLTMKKEILKYEIDNKKVKKLIEKEKINETTIKERVNKLYNKAKEIEKKNFHDRNEHDLVSQYYYTIIENKWSFIKSSDERKEKQNKISLDAKLDTQDKSEVDKRKVLHTTILYNKYLKRKMQEVIKKNEHLETIYQNIRKQTGQTDLKATVQRIMNRDKDYNLAIKTVTDFEAKREVTLTQIRELERDLENLKNQLIATEDNIDEDNGQNIEVSDMAKTKSQQIFHHHENSDAKDEEKDEELLLMEEIVLKKQQQEAIRLKSEQVYENLKNLIYKDSADKQSKSTQITEEDILGGFTTYLSKTKDSLDNLFLNHNRQEHLEILKKRALEKQTLSKEKTVQNFSNFTRGSFNEMDQNYQRSMPNIKIVGSGLNEYDYTPDNDVNKDEDEIKKEVNEIISDYKNKIKLEKLKEEKEKGKK